MKSGIILCLCLTIYIFETSTKSSVEDGWMDGWMDRPANGSLFFKLINLLSAWNLVSAHVIFSLCCDMWDL